MKKMLIFALIASSAIVFSACTSSVSQERPTSELSLPVTQGTQATTPSPDITKTYTADEVAKHATKDDCWFIIDNGVYNVTEFIPRHPGGQREIIMNCGKDATEAFNTQGGEGQHSAVAQKMKEQYRIGTLQ